MPSPHLDRKHARATSGMKCHHRFWTSHSIERRSALHAIIALRQHKWSNDVGRGLTSPLLDFTFGQTTSGVACHHRFKAAQTVERRRARDDLTVLGLHARWDNVRRGMTSPPWDSTHGRQRRAWHDINALGQHTRYDDVGRGMT